MAGGMGMNFGYDLTRVQDLMSSWFRIDSPGLLHIFKVQWCQILKFKSVQCHPGLTYIFNF